jgi:hypothetical protein
MSQIVANDIRFNTCIKGVQFVLQQALRASRCAAGESDSDENEEEEEDEDDEEEDEEEEQNQPGEWCGSLWAVHTLRLDIIDFNKINNMEQFLILYQLEGLSRHSLHSVEDKSHCRIHEKPVLKSDIQSPPLYNCFLTIHYNIPFS